MLKRLTIVIYLAVLLTIVLGSWLPRSCPILKQVLSSCPTFSPDAGLSAHQIELNRIPHQVVNKSNIVFSAKSQDFRKTTGVIFPYFTDYTTQEAYLYVNTSEGYIPLATITHPLLVNLSWPRLASQDPLISLYQQSENFTTIDEFRNTLPPANTIALDAIVARRWNLKEDQYTRLEELTTLEGISYVVAAFYPPTVDGEWREFNQTFDTSTAKVNALNELEWKINLPLYTKDKKEFLLGLIHIDYKTLK